MEALQAWIDDGADVNYANSDGFTPLMASATNGDLLSVKILVQNQADIDLKDRKEFTALRYATYNNRLEIVQYLMDNGAVMTDEIYMTAIHKNFKEIVEFFDKNQH